MHKIVSFVVIFAVVFAVIGCGGSPKEQQPVVKVDKPAEPAATDKVVKEQPKEVKDAPVVSVTPAPQPKKPAGEWTLVLKMEGNIEKTDKDNCLKAIREKWFKDKTYTEVSNEEFNKDMAPFEGQKVLFAEVFYQYGEFEMTIRSGKIEKEGTDFLEKPLDDAPNGNIRGQSTMDDMIKEIRFFK